MLFARPKRKPCVCCRHTRRLQSPLPVTFRPRNIIRISTSTRKSTRTRTMKTATKKAPEEAVGSMVQACVPEALSRCENIARNRCVSACAHQVCGNRAFIETERLMPLSRRVAPRSHHSQSMELVVGHFRPSSADLALGCKNRYIGDERLTRKLYQRAHDTSLMTIRSRCIYELTAFWRCAIVSGSNCRPTETALTPLRRLRTICWCDLNRDAMEFLDDAAWRPSALLKLCRPKH